MSQRELADRVGLSQNACWRRLQRECLRHHPWHAGRGQPGGAGPGPDGVRHDPDQPPRQAWADGFRLHVERLPEVTEFYRIGGDWDYLIKVVCRGMAGYDRFYQKLITDFELSTVTGFFAMEAIIENRPPDLRVLEG